MFERFTDSSRRVLTLAQAEAKTFGHSEIGVEHVLCALIVEGDGVAARVLGGLGMTAEKVRVCYPGDGDNRNDLSARPFTAAVKKLLELALREALQLGHNYVGTEHLLLGLVREGWDWTSTLGFDFTLADVRQKTIELLSKHGRHPTPVLQGTAGTPFVTVGDLRRLFDREGFDDDQIILIYHGKVIPVVLGVNPPKTEPLDLEAVYTVNIGGHELAKALGENLVRKRRESEQ